MPHSSTSRDLRRPAVALALAATAALAAVMIYLIKQGDPAAAPARQTNTPAPTQAPPTTATSPSYSCRAVATEDRNGIPLPESWLTTVREVHDAACGRDYGTLQGLMSNPFNGALTPEEVIADWRTTDPEGVFLIILAATLEQKGVASQGGLVYCQEHGAVAVFSRGTVDKPGTWEYFDTVRADGLYPC